jgi:N-acetylneuraminic acid mutarotase
MVGSWFPDSWLGAGVRRGVASVAVIAAFLLTLAAPAAAQTWRKLATSGVGPGERSSPAVVSLGSSIFLFGGVRDDFSAASDVFLDDLYRFDTRTNQWEAIVVSGARPPARAFAGAVAHRGRGWMAVVGGAHYGPFFSDFIGFDDLWAFDPAARAWHQILPKNRGPIGRSAPSVWIEGDRLYVFGGVTSDFATLNDLWSYDFRSNRWKQLSPNGAPAAPPSRHEAMAGERPIDGRLLLYGGEHFDPATGFSILNDVWEYDLSCGRWREVKPAPDVSPPRNYAATAEIGGQLYLQGGDMPGGSEGCGAPFPQNPVSEVWRFQPKGRRWQPLAPAGDSPTRLKRHKAAVVDKRMYVVSGWDFQCPGPGQIWNLDVFVLTP